MSAPLVSVILPVYNVAPLLKRCIESLANQTFRDFEVIIVDDCSTDESPALCDALADSFHQCTVIHHEKNGGLSAARNTGVAAASGKLISFVDSDDWVAPTYLETLTRALNDNNADASQICSVMCSDFVEVNQSPEVINVMNGPEAVAFMLEIEEYAVWLRLYRRELFKQDEEWFPVGLTCEDRVANINLLGRAKTVATSNRKEYFYFQNPGSISNDGLTRKAFDLLEADRRMVESAKALGDHTVIKLTEDRAAKGPYSLLVKWARFGVTDKLLNEKEALETLWPLFNSNYRRVMASPLSFAKKLVAWQLKHCPRVLQAEFKMFNLVRGTNR